MSRAVLLLLGLFCHWGTGLACFPATADDRGEVRFVYDGDTVLLEDGRRLRLIGINAPETRHRGSPAQALSGAARDSLRQILHGTGKVTIIHGQQRRDRYGRELVYLRLADGRDPAAELLARGMAQYIAVPPNLMGLECYRHREQTARERGLGMWSLQRYGPQPVNDLRGLEPGFYLVRGQVQNVGESSSSLWLDFDGEFSLRIPKRDLVHFDEPAPETLRGRWIEARGWIARHRGRQRMNLRHPANLNLLDGPE